MWLQLQSFVGLILLLVVAWGIGPKERRAGISWRCVGWGVGLQFALAVLILKLPTVRWFFSVAKDLANAMLAHASAGAKMVFGVLADAERLGSVFGPENAGIFALQTIVPVIIFFAALMAVLYHIGLMQRLVGAVARLMVRFMGTSGAETVACVSNVFLGMTEAALFVRPYLAAMTRSEMLCLMTGGMATIAGTVFAVYVGFLQTAMPDIAGHLLTASVMSAPAALAAAKLMLPETETPATLGRVEISRQSPYANVVDALTGGAMEGLKLSASVVAMLIAMVAVVSLANSVLGWPARSHNQRIIAAIETPGSNDVPAPDPADPEAVRTWAAQRGVVATPWRPLSFERIASWAFTPLAWCLGLPASDIPSAARLLGEKTILNEFIAYLDMAQLLERDPGRLTPRGRVIMSYALCGFANLGSVAIMIGGIGALVPTRRRDLAELGLLSLVGGTLAAAMTGCVVGIVTGG